MDELTYTLVEVPKLYDVMNTAITATGAAVLERSLRQPLQSAELIRAKQDAVSEVAMNTSLRSNLKAYLQELHQSEDSLYDYFFSKYSTSALFTSRTYYQHNLYDVYKGTREFLKSATENLKDVSSDSIYVNILLNHLRELGEAEIYNWIEKPIHRTPIGLKNDKKVHKLEPKLTFKPRDLKPYRYLIFPAITTIMMGTILTSLIDVTTDPEAAKRLVGAYESGALMGFMFDIMMTDQGRLFDDSVFVRPIGKKYFSNPLILSAIESVGMLDELLMLVNYAEKFQGPVCLPEVTNDSPHHFSATKLRNPYLAAGIKPNYVANDVHLDGQRITFLTGPVSGGKTALSKTIAQTQVLAQIGSPVPAEHARISVADRVFYQSPMTQELDDELGRFATEAKRVAGIFYKTTPNSLIIFDELIEATTTEEKLKLSYEIMDDFSKIGANIVLVTHNHQLVEQFKKKGRGQYLKFRFVGKRSTHELREGISTESHSEEALEKIHFSHENRQRFLRKKGYIT